MCNNGKKWSLLNKNEWIFDHIVSLGGFCQVAYQLDRLKLRFEAFPFDWIFSTNVERVLEALENDFQDWILEENLIESEFTETGHRRVVDTKYETVIQHAFPLDKSWREAYPKVSEMTRRRVDRLLNLRGGGDTLFIRTNLDEEQSLRMASVISEKYGDNAKLLVVNLTHNFAMKELPAELDNLYRVEIYTYDEDWRGYNPHWNKLFSDIRLRTVNVDFHDDTYFEGFHTCEARTRRNLFRWSTGEGTLHLEEYGGCKCQLHFSAPIPMELEIINAHGEKMAQIDFQGTSHYGFNIVHETRFIKLKTKTWTPKKIFGTKDCRQLGVCLEGIEIERPAWKPCGTGNGW